MALLFLFFIYIVVIVIDMYVSSEKILDNEIKVGSDSHYISTQIHKTCECCLHIFQHYTLKNRFRCLSITMTTTIIISRRKNISIFKSIRSLSKRLVFYINVSIVIGNILLHRKMYSLLFKVRNQRGSYPYLVCYCPSIFSIKNPPDNS